MRFRRLAVVTIAATFVLIAVGGLVRATDSGLGCPDWPRCFGKLVPPAELHAWIEHSHRLVASVVVVLVALLVVAAYRTGQERAVRRAAVAALVMVLAQASSGASWVWSWSRVGPCPGPPLALVARSSPSASGPGWPVDRSRAQGQEPPASLALSRSGPALNSLQMRSATVTAPTTGCPYPLNVLLPPGPSVALIHLLHRPWPCWSGPWS